jgi:hypothetical protein
VIALEQSLFGSELYWVNFANVLLGVAVVVFIAWVAGAVLFGIYEQWHKRSGHFAGMHQPMAFAGFPRHGRKHGPGSMKELPYHGPDASGRARSGRAR